VSIEDLVFFTNIAHGFIAERIPLSVVVSFENKVFMILLATIIPEISPLDRVAACGPI
jgi:hypothetical protein